MEGREVRPTRSHNEGSLFQRKSGKQKGAWVALVTMRSGKRVSRYAKDRDTAKAQLAELLRLRDAGAPITDRIRLGAFLERWVSDGHGWAPATYRKHATIVRVHLVPALGHLRMSEMSVVDVDRVLGQLPVGPRSAAHVRATLRRAFADALRDGVVTRNPGALSRPIRQPHRERTILDANQARILIGVESRYAPLWTILVTTGLRISEALGLLWSDVDFGGNDGSLRADGDGVRAHGGLRGATTGEARLRTGGAAGSPGVGGARPHGAGPSITVRHQLARENGEWVRRPPKTAKGRRTIPLTPLGVEAFRRQRAQQDTDLGARPRPIDGLVFTSPTGNPLHETNTLKALQADLATAGLPRVTQHDLRHSCATLLYSMGVPLETIADILGHTSSRITSDLYRHRVAQLQQDAADKLQEVLG